MVRPTTIRLVTFPASDHAFRAHVEAAVELLPADGAVSSAHCRRVEAEVRLAYPRASVRAQDALATLAVGGPSAWYAYRDGQIEGRGAEEDWSMDESLPRMKFDDRGTYFAANQAAADLVGVPIEAILGSRIGRFTRHEPTDSPGLRAFDVLAREGSLESTAIVVRPDGDEIPVDYRIVSADDGFEMVLRNRR